MGEIMNTKEYFAAVSRITSSILDRNSGKQYGLRPLFLKQRLSQGIYAFMSYADLTDKANDDMASSVSPQYELGRRIRNKIDIRLGNSSSAPSTKECSDTLSRIRQALDLDTTRSDETKSEGQKATKEHALDDIIKFDNAVKSKSANGQSLLKGRLGDEPDLSIKTESPLTYKDYLFQTRNADLLLEDLSEECDILLYSDAAESRVIILAGAGYGKSTLIQRLALAYSPSDMDTEEDRESDKALRTAIEESEISDELIPCVIELRNCAGIVNNLNDCIRQAVGELYLDHGQTEIDSWLLTVNKKLLLLIDGLDELPKDLACEFLKSLNLFLLSNQDVRVIITSRVAGLDDNSIQTLLRKMRFHGRTIMPLDEQETRDFCQKWIAVTNDSNDLMKNLERIRTEPHLSYLRDFMRKPLELMMLLHHIPKQSFSTFNRWELFYNILWAEVTNHVDFDSKQLVFDDECKLLGYIAYKMQLKDRMSISYNELSDMVYDIQELSFYSDLFFTEGSSELITTETIWLHFKTLAQNIGVIETIDGGRSVTIPIRSYQEYLAAYACCNLNLIDGEYSPNPQKILLPYINNSSWIGVLGFAIAGMEYSSYSELDEFLKKLYAGTDSVSRLCSLLDTDYFNSRNVARVLCEIHFKKSSINEEKKRLLLKCMDTKSASSFRLALTALYKNTHDSGRVEYLEAAAYAYLSGCMNKKDDPIQYAEQLLGSNSMYEKSIAAGILIITARIVLGEEPIKQTDSIQGEISDEMCESLYQLAIQTESYVFVQALSELYSCQIVGYEKIRVRLDDKLLGIACEYLMRQSRMIISMISTKQTLEADYLQHIRHVINMVGTFPVTVVRKHRISSSAMWINALIDCYYEVARDDIDFDQVGIAVCRLHMGGSWDAFLNRWVEDICKGRPSSQVRKEHLTARENNHFKMVCLDVVEDEKEYFIKHESVLNSIDVTIGRNPTQLFAEGKDSEAMECAIKQYRIGGLIGENNMAFLVRYMKYDTVEEFGISRFEFIQKLLRPGVVNREPYSVMNFTLALLEEQRMDEAMGLIAEMNGEDIRIIAESFWYPEMWQKRKTPEGALVCLIAQKRGDKEYAEQADMLECILKNQPQWARLI